MATLNPANIAPSAKPALAASDAGAPAAAAEVLKGIVIPSCPAVLMDLRAEIASDDPDTRKISRLVSADVALSVAVLRTVNSPYYALNRKVESIDQAVSMIGLRQVSTLVTSILLRQSLEGKGMNLVRFWDVSNKRSYAMMTMARRLKCVDPELAQSFGLFCDIGIPLLMQRFPDYGMTLKMANEEETLLFTDVESQRHGADHAHIGALMARAWGLSDTLCAAIRLHHDYTLFDDTKIPTQVAKLVAMCLVAELAIQRFARLNSSVEWNKGGDRATGNLMLSDQDLEDWIDLLGEGFAKAGD